LLQVSYRTLTKRGSQTRCCLQYESPHRPH
jgi:hypothetical protein